MALQCLFVMHCEEEKNHRVKNKLAPHFLNEFPVANSGKTDAQAPGSLKFVRNTISDMCATIAESVVRFFKTEKPVAELSRTLLSQSDT